MPELDKMPYREMMGFQRWESRAMAPDYMALVFDPRYGYSQDESEYSWHYSRKGLTS